MISLLKDYWPYLLGLFLLLGHIPIRAALQPRKYSLADKVLATWESVSIDIRKAAKAMGKRIPWLEPLVIVVEAIAPIEVREEIPPPPPDSTTKPITIEPPPEPPRAA